MLVIGTYQLKDASVRDANATPPTIGRRDPTTQTVGNCHVIQYKITNFLKFEAFSLHSICIGIKNYLAKENCRKNNRKERFHSLDGMRK